MRRTRTLLLVLPALLLVSCPKPLNVGLVAQFNDHIGPVIAINEPGDGTAYSTTIRVSGSVSDAGDFPGHIDQCGFSIEGTPVQGAFSRDDDGGFSFLVATRSPDGTVLASGLISLTVFATDWSGNESSTSIRLVPASTGDIPGFTASPASGEALLQWPEVPGAVSYSLFEAKYGVSRDDVESPYVWSGLYNGDVYGFQLTAIMEDGLADDAVSSVVEVMPQSPRTFAPWVRESGYKSISIEWWHSPFVSEYTVERSLSPNGPWEVHRNTAINVFRDTNVQHGTEYHYRITAAGFGGEPSGSIHASPGRFGREVLTYWTDAGNAVDVAVQPSFAYVSAGYSHIGILDTSDPANPFQVAQLDTGYVPGLEVSGSYLYASRHGLLTVDVSDPANPGTPTSLSLGAQTGGIAVSGSHAYIAAWESGLAVYDVLDPDDPQGPYSCPITGTSVSVAVNEPYAYVAYHTTDPDEGGLAIVDVSDPTNPAVLSYRQTSGRSYRVAVSGDYAYLTSSYPVFQSDYTGVAIIDVSNPLDPTPPDPVYRLTEMEPAELVIVGDVAYMGCMRDGLAVADLTDPLNPGTPVTTLTTGMAQALAVSGDHAYVTDNASGLAVIDLAHPLAAVSQAYRATAGFSADVVVSGFHAYVADWDEGLAIIDISDPEAPGEPIHQLTGSSARGLAVADGYAFVAANWMGLAVIDVTNPTDPGDPVFFPIPWDAIDVTVAGPWAYVAGGDSGLVIIDVSDPTAPGDAVYQRTDGFARGITVRHPWAYVADDTAGLAIIDVTDPRNPKEPEYFADWPAGADAQRVTIKGDFAYVAAGNGGLVVVDISDPLNPGLHPAIPTDPFVPYADAGYAKDVTTSGAYVFLADGWTGELGIIDVSDPDILPTPVYWPAGGNAYGVTVVEEYAYVVNNDGLVVVKLWEEP